MLIQPNFQTSFDTHLLLFNSPSDAWRREGKVSVRRFRGYGAYDNDYTLHFQSGNTFVADVVLCSGKFYMEISILEIDSVVQFGFFTDGFLHFES